MLYGVKAERNALWLFVQYGAVHFAIVTLCGRAIVLMIPEVDETYDIASNLEQSGSEIMQMQYNRPDANFQRFTCRDVGNKCSTFIVLFPAHIFCEVTDATWKHTRRCIEANIHCL